MMAAAGLVGRVISRQHASQLRSVSNLASFVWHFHSRKKIQEVKLKTTIINLWAKVDHSNLS